MRHHRVILSAIAAAGLGYGLIRLTLLPGSDGEGATSLGVGTQQKEQAPGAYAGVASSEPARLRELHGVFREANAPETAVESPVFSDLITSLTEPAHLGEPINAGNVETWRRFQPKTDSVHIGSEIDADDPREYALDDRSSASRHIGPLLDADTPSAGVLSVRGESPVHLGPRLNAHDL